MLIIAETPVFKLLQAFLGRRRINSGVYYSKKLREIILVLVFHDSLASPSSKYHLHSPFFYIEDFRQYRTELVVQNAYGQTSLTRQIFRQIV